MYQDPSEEAPLAHCGGSSGYAWIVGTEQPGCFVQCKYILRREKYYREELQLCSMVQNGYAAENKHYKIEPHGRGLR